MTRLRGAAPGVRVVGMTYYLPALAEWLNGTAGQVIARLSEKLAAAYSELLGRAYAGSGARIADVFSASTPRTSAIRSRCRRSAPSRATSP